MISSLYCKNKKQQTSQSWDRIINTKKIADWNNLTDRTPTYAMVAYVDLVIVRYDDNACIRYLNHDALISDGNISGDYIYSVHNEDYRCDTGISEW